MCEDAGVTGDGAIALDNIDVRGHINGMEEPTDQITAQTPTVLDNRRPPGSSANSISSALSSFSGDNTREAATLQLGSSGAIPKKRVAPAPPPKKAQLSENSAGAAENDELRLFQLEKVSRNRAAHWEKKWNYRKFF